MSRTPNLQYQATQHYHIYHSMSMTMTISAGSIPGFVRYRSIPEFCSILDTYVVIKSNFHIEHSSQ